MKRLIENELLNWRYNSTKPLIIFGSRQVGKTYTVLDFAKQNYNDKFVYINFFENSLYKKMLNDKTSPKEIIEIISSIAKKEIGDDFLLIFDEIQEIPSLKLSLKLFVDLKINIKIIALGSYLKNTLENNDYAFPVGKVEFLYMFPMNFQEFLMALNQEILIKKIKNSLDSFEPLPKHDHELLLEYLYKYMIVGGMPEVVNEFVEKDNLVKCTILKQNIIDGYRLDLLRYLDKKDKLKAISIFDNIAKFLIKENKRFKLNNLDSSARYLNYESIVKNLMSTQIIYKINNLKNYSLPFTLNEIESQFKFYLNDCGLLANLLDINYYELVELKNDNYTSIRGGLTENYVVNQLMSLKNNINQFNYYSYYEEGSRNYHEIDLVLSNTENNIAPIEIKLSNKFTKKSFNKLITSYDVKSPIIFSTKNLGYFDNYFSIPLYMISFLKFENNKINLEFLKKSKFDK